MRPHPRFADGPNPAARAAGPGTAYRLRLRLLAALTSAALLAAALVGLTPAPADLLGLVPAAHASAVDPRLAPTPYQGWNTYYGLGGDMTESEVLDVARTMNRTGLRSAGYDIVWLDGGWTGTPYRDASGELRADPARFPHGMAWLTARLHAMGFRTGIYTDAGTKSDACGVASGDDNQQRDANTFARWGFDAVKVDFVCGFAARNDVRPMMTRMIAAIRANASHRRMIVNLCNPVTSPDWGDFPESQQSIGSWRYAPQIAESWRTYTDVGFVGSIRFADVLRNHDANAAHPEVAGPGRWSDPDYLGPQLGMSDTEFRTQMSLWAISAAPLVIASDVRTLSPASLAALTDRDVLAIDQDRLGQQGRRLSAAGPQEVWGRRLADGSRAVLLLNRADEPAAVGTTVRALGLGRGVRVRDAWTDTVSHAEEQIRQSVPAHGAVLLRIWPERRAGAPARLTTTTAVATTIDGAAIAPTTAPLVSAGSTVDLTLAVRDDGSRPVTDLRARVQTPPAWQAQARVDGRLLHPRQSAPVRIRLTIPADAPVGQTEVTVRITARGGVSDPVTVPVMVSPPAPRGTTDLAHHRWISATSAWKDPAVDAAVGGQSALRVAGAEHATGIGVAAPSAIRYDLGARCTHLTGGVGIDDAVSFDPQGGTVRFRILGDGRPLWDSGPVARGTLHAVDADLTGVRDLRLIVEDGGDGGYNDRADWTDLSATCTP